VEKHDGLQIEIRVERGSEAAPFLVRWTSYGALSGKRIQPHHCYALATPDGPVLIDPEEVPPAAWAGFESLLRRLGSGQAPVATLLTSSWHERAAYRFRERLGTPVWLPRGGQPDAEGTPDHLFEDGKVLPGGLTAITVGDPPGGDTAFLWQAPDGERILFSGDLLLGGSGFALDPERSPGHWRYVPGLYAWTHGEVAGEDFKTRFRRLLKVQFEVVFSAHGVPVPFVNDPRAALAALLETGRFGAPSMGTGLVSPR
jgi:glyoxylase-like metal-dependent hydrolase (beta-lactamase superfamily II)